jgi:hypothetical protein
MSPAPAAMRCSRWRSASRSGDDSGEEITSSRARPCSSRARQQAAGLGGQGDLAHVPHRDGQDSRRTGIGGRCAGRAALRCGRRDQAGAVLRLRALHPCPCPRPRSPIRARERGSWRSMPQHRPWH